MVQVLSDPTLSPVGSPIHEIAETWRTSTPPSARPMSREEHAQRIKELDLKRGLVRAPRRGWSMTDYQDEHTHDNAPSSHTPSPHPDREPTIPENAPLPPSTAASPAPEALTRNPPQQLPRRPKAPPPRRSYTVMDYEPAMPPGQPRPSTRLTLLDLPSELHYQLLDFLDPIDSVCLGLAHSRLYPIHRRKYGTVPLSARYSGPNNLEWAWRGAGQPKTAKEKVEQQQQQQQQLEQARALEKLRVKGQVYCRKCGVYRCELRRHLKDWVGEGYEYCEIKEMYGPLAGDEAKPYCFMSSPKDCRRCGRHGGRKAIAVTEKTAPATATPLE